MKTLTLFLAISISLCARSQTYINGFISVNTTWTTANSPFIINGNTILQNGITLTIEPGVVIQLDTNKAFTIDGELIAIGDSANFILFTSLQSMPGAGDWGKIAFSDFSEDAVLDSSGEYVSGSILKYCEINYGGSLGISAISVDNSAPYIRYCRILNSKNAGILLRDSRTSIKHCYFEGNQSNAIGYWFSNYGIQQAEINNNSIVNNNGGIIINNSNLIDHATIYIKNNHFESNGPKPVIDNTSKGIVISNNDFIGNHTDIGSGLIYFNRCESYNIECNRFVDNDISGTSLLNLPRSDGIIQNNLFDGNLSTTFGNTLSIIRGPNVYFHNNVIRNNDCNGPCFLFQCYSCQSESFHIAENEFLNNSGQSMIRISLSGAITGTNYAYVKHNNFNDPLASWELYNSIPSNASSLLADSNYWNSTNTQHIDSVIYDYFDNGANSIVYYQPILQSPVIVDTSCTPSITTWLSELAFEEITSSVFPNPVVNQSQINLSRPVINGMLKIYNLLGECIATKRIINSENVLLDKKDLPSGLLFYSLLDSNKSIAKGKFLVF